MTQANPLFPVKEQFPALDKDITVDIAIAGGGIAGISCAYHLSQKGYKVVVLEEQEIGAGATGASSGILYYGTGTDFTKAIELFGKEKATMLWEETKRTIENIINIADKNAIDCDVRKDGAIMVAKNEDEKKFLEEELRNLKSIGFEGELLETKDIKNYFAQREFIAGLKQDIAVQIVPAMFAAGLAKKANIDVYNNTPVLNHKEENDGVITETPKAKVKANKIIFTMNRKPFFGLENYFFIENSAIMATKQLSKEQIRKIWPEHKFIWTLEEKYDLIYEHGARALLEVYYLKGWKEKLAYYYPNFEFVREYTWGDSFSKTNDWLPIVGNVKENIYCSIAMGDQGIVTGFTAGRKAVDMIEGKQDRFLEIASPKRFKI